MNTGLLTIDFARDLILRKETTATALADSFYGKIASADSEVHAYLSLTRERALTRAAEIETMADREEELPPLAGVPIAIKDTFMTRGTVTTAGSRILENFVSSYDATSVARLEAAGAIILGKTNCDEFAMGSSNENSAYGHASNPRDLSRVPGGSSGGSAAAVAAGTAVSALGSDTGGSIRQPAAFCGVVGLKPTYGRISRYGLIAFASSLDHVGPITKSVKDAAIMLQVLAGHDSRDATSADVPVSDYVGAVGESVKGMRIGVPDEYFPAGLDPEIHQSIERSLENLRSAGCEVKRISLPHTKYAIPAYYLIATAEASANLARYDGARYGFRAEGSRTIAEMYRTSRDQGFGTEVKRRILLGTYALSAGYYDAYYLKAQRVRTLLAQDFQNAFREADVIVTPTTPTPAFKFGEKIEDPLSMYLADVFTVTANLAGIPALSVPCGNTREGLPIGLQILGKHFDECTMLRIGHVIEHELAK